MVSPAAILMLTSSLSNSLGSLGRCLHNKTHAITFFFLKNVSILTFFNAYLALCCSKKSVIEVNLTVVKGLTVGLTCAGRL